MYPQKVIGKKNERSPPSGGQGSSQGYLKSPMHLAILAIFAEAKKNGWQQMHLCVIGGINSLMTICTSHELIFGF